MSKMQLEVTKDHVQGFKSAMRVIKAWFIENPNLTPNEIINLIGALDDKVDNYIFPEEKEGK